MLRRIKKKNNQRNCNSRMKWNESHWDEIIYCGTANKSVYNVENGKKLLFR